MTESAVSEFIDRICHYRQEDDNMCAQHCLNALIQQPHYAVMLAEIATELDVQERETYLVAGAGSLDYLKAMQVYLIITADIECTMDACKSHVIFL